MTNLDKLDRITDIIDKLHLDTIKIRIIDIQTWDLYIALFNINEVLKDKEANNGS